MIFWGSLRPVTLKLFFLEIVGLSVRVMSTYMPASFVKKAFSFI